MAPTVPIEFSGQKESRKWSLSQTMGKSKKYSKGILSGFVPDNRHAVETIGESEGFGSSGRVDREVTISEDSFAVKRKCVSVSADGCGSYGVPIHVLPMSKMSRSERKDLKSRLKIELEQVRTLQNKFMQNVALSKSSNIRSCTNGKKRALSENFSASTEVSAPHGKKRALAGKNGHRMKKGALAQFEPVKPAVQGSNLTTSLMKRCDTLLKHLMAHGYGWVFNTPVDVVELNLPDYYSFIKHPMDLGTVRNKMDAGEYTSPLAFAADVRLTFSNAMAYNPPGNDVHTMADQLSKLFEKRWKAIEKKMPVTTDGKELPSRSVHVDAEATLHAPPVQRTRPSIDDSDVLQQTVVETVTDEMKHKLSMELEALLGDLPENIIDFLKEHCFNSGQTSEDEIEIDIYALSEETLLALRKLLDEYLSEKQKNRAKPETCELELHNESGVSTSSIQPCKGNDLVDEDVDIVGGNDVPISSYPAVEIEKDAALRNSKCSSTSSSSSELDSSSSGDSGSGSSSESESDAARALGPAKATKEALDLKANSDHKNGDVGCSENKTFSAKAGDLNEQNSVSKSISVRIDSNQDGESAPSERQVSPEKLHRAALLRSRFADTILKAQEKALEKGDKRDPEKLRLEREQLERQQREEKARLHAEAKAAEEARRKAEAEAAAEAKRRREIEREAARQALQNMEKTVDINENSQFMEDLELLRASHDESLPSFTDETVLDNSENLLGSFKLQGNPLEQLGLYRKDDFEYEEEEGEATQDVIEPADDVEEGEID